MMLRCPPDAKQYMPSRYTQLSNIYNQGEFEDIQRLLDNLSANCLHNVKYPILKLLRAVCRCLLINELQSIFLAYVIQTNGWNIHDPIIMKYRYDVNDIVFYSTQDVQYKGLTLYLLLCGYTAKYYLNECTDMYTNQLEKICTDFKTVFSQWVKQEAPTTLKINPRSLNKVYKQIYLEEKKGVMKNNYSSLVDNILVICPCYNSDKQKPGAGPSKHETSVGKVPAKHPMNMSITVANLPILSSSGFLQQIGIIPTNQQVVLNDISQNEKMSFLGSSEFGINNLNNGVFPFQQGVDINYITVGFRQCLSDNQDNMSKMGASEDDNIGLLKIKRNSSNTSSYFS